MSHPASCTNPDCDLSYRDHLLTIAISADATPTRRPRSHNTNVRERVLSRDMDAYKTMRRNGIQPPHVDGAAEVLSRAESPADVSKIGNQAHKSRWMT